MIKLNIRLAYNYSCRTYGLTCARAIAVQVFRWTSCPSRDLPFTMQYGTPIMRHNAGRHTTIYEKCSRNLIAEFDSNKTQILIKFKISFKKLDLMQQMSIQIVSRISSHLFKLDITFLWRVKQYFDWVDVVSDDYELCLLLLNERCDWVDAKAQNRRPLGGSIFTCLLSLLSALSQTCLLLLLRFRLVLVQ